MLLQVCFEASVVDRPFLRNKRTCLSQNETLGHLVNRSDTALSLHKASVSVIPSHAISRSRTLPSRTLVILSGSQYVILGAYLEGKVFCLTVLKDWRSLLRLSLQWELFFVGSMLGRLILGNSHIEDSVDFHKDTQFAERAIFSLSAIYRGKFCHVRCVFLRFCEN